jgi:methionyl-tRNA formyltransferase
MRVVFMGTGEIGLPSLRALIARPDCELVAVVTQPDKPAGRGKHLQAPEVKRVAEAAGIPVLQPHKLREPEAVAQLAAYEPDVIVVMAYGQILPRIVLDLPRLACLNLHASLLPRHRGASPIQAAILAGDAVTGITVMYMAEGLDTGDMLLAHEIPILAEDTGGSLHDRLADLAPEAMNAALDLIAAGAAPRTPQDNGLATYAGKLTRENGRIDWSLPAADIERHIRAMNPWPAAFTGVPLASSEVARLKIHSVAIEAVEPSLPGALLRADRDGIVVAAGEGALRLLEVQGEGGRRMRSSEWLKGHPIAAGGICGGRL